MPRLRQSSIVTIALLLAGITGSAVAGNSPRVETEAGGQRVRHIDFADYMAAQTTTFTTIAYIGLSGYTAGIDFLGVRATAWGFDFGYSSSGNVTVRTLPDGSGEVQVNMNFANAIMWAFDPQSTPVFAYSPATLAGDPSLTPGLGSGHMQLKYAVPDAENPELDFLKILFFGGDATFESLKFHAQGAGPLREGFGVPTGTPGTCAIGENDRVQPDGDGVASVERVEVKVADGFEAEAVKFRSRPGAASTGGSVETKTPAATGSWGSIKTLYR